MAFMEGRELSSGQWFVVYDLAADVGYDYPLSCCDIPIPSKVARDGDGFLARSLVVGKILPIDIVGTGTVKMKEIARHGCGAHQLETPAGRFGSQGKS
jgi:hypothetical protein